MKARVFFFLVVLLLLVLDLGPCSGGVLAKSNKRKKRKRKVQATKPKPKKKAKPKPKRKPKNKKTRKPKKQAAPAKKATPPPVQRGKQKVTNKRTRKGKTEAGTCTVNDASFDGSFGPGKSLRYSCPGKQYKAFKGSRVRTCVDGQLSGQQLFCRHAKNKRDVKPALAMLVGK